MKKLNLILLLVFTLANTTLKAQEHKPIIIKGTVEMQNKNNDASSPVKWDFKTEKINSNEVVVMFIATIKPGYHIYSQKAISGGPVKTTFTFQPSEKYTLIGGVTEPNPVTAYDKVFKMKVAYFKDKVVFKQRVKYPGEHFVAMVSVEYMAGDDTKNLPPFTAKLVVGS